MRPAARRLDRALVVLPSVTLGGTEQQTAVLARAMAEARLEVTLAMEPALRPDFAALPGAASELRSVTGPFGWQAGATAADNIAAQAAALAPLLQGLRPDLVILPLPWPGHGFGLLQALAAAGQRTLVIQHLAPQIADPVPEAAAPVLATLAAAPIRWAAVSAPVAARAAAFFGLPPAAVAVVPN
ncbi:glycosyltransferase, partial [Paracraurococcus ruber]